MERTLNWTQHPDCSSPSHHLPGKWFSQMKRLKGRWCWDSRTMRAFKKGHQLPFWGFLVLGHWETLHLTLLSFPTESNCLAKIFSIRKEIPSGEITFFPDLTTGLKQEVNLAHFIIQIFPGESSLEKPHAQ